MTWHRHSAHVTNTARWRLLRRQILKRDGYKCVQCGAAGMLECDHIKPVRWGGAEYDPENLQMLCRSCHGSKTQSEVWKNGKPDPEKLKWNKLLRGKL